MLRNFSDVVKDHRNEPVLVGLTPDSMLAGVRAALAKLPADSKKILQDCVKGAVGKSVTFGDACADALVAPIPNETQPKGESVLKLKLAMKIVQGGNIDILPDERDLIKASVDRYYTGAVIPGRITQMLEDMA